MNSKLLVPSSILICTILLFLSCSENSVTEEVKTLLDKQIAKQIAGQYESVVFTATGPHDGGVDILASGGIITVRLFDNYKVEGYLVIPDSSDIPFAPKDEDFNGKFILSADRLHFSNTNTFLDNDMWWFVVSGNELETPNWTGWRIPTKIILEKQ